VQKRFNYTGNYEFTPFEELDSCYRFSTAVAMFGSLLRASSFTKNISWNDIILIAQQSAGKGDILQNEFVTLVQQAKALYTKGKKKRSGTKKNDL
jgi:Ca-activated chloride channel family protein